MKLIFRLHGLYYGDKPGMRMGMRGVFSPYEDFIRIFYHSTPVYGFKEYILKRVG